MALLASTNSTFSVPATSCCGSAGCVSGVVPVSGAGSVVSVPVSGGVVVSATPSTVSLGSTGCSVAVESDSVDTSV